MPCNSEFRCQGDKAHLTFKTHVDKDVMHALILSFGPMKIYSFVHEVGDEDEEGYPEDHEGPYEHTHVFVQWKERLDIANARAWDVGDIHPHLQASKGMMWAKGICMKYHLGHKTKADGKKYFIKPVLLIQEGVREWKWECDMFEICLSAPTLIEACIALDMVPKSIGDINLIRKQGKKKDFACPEPKCLSQLMKPRDEIIALGWDPEEQVLILRGSGGRGKTNWALSQGRKAHLISNIDDLKKICDDCDLLVFDEMKFGAGKLLQDKNGMITLTDHKFSRSIYARNQNATVPVVKRIFCINEFESVFGDDPFLGGHYSVQRRIFEFDTDKH